MNHNELAKTIHAANVAKGFYENPVSQKTRVLLIISEVVECMEADRKGKRAKVEHYKAEIKVIKQRKNLSDSMFKHLFESYIKDTVEDELADVAIRLYDFAGYKGLLILQEVNDEFDFDFSEYAWAGLSDWLFDIVKDLEILHKDTQSSDIDLTYSLGQVYEVARKLEIDLTYHIEQKLKYNSLREHKHGGKKY